MGVKDSKAKEYLSDNIRFSEICNYMLFGGDKIIKPQDLRECDSTEVLSIFGIDKKQIVRQKWRDLLKSVLVKYTGNMYIVLIGIEAQTNVHYAMPVKTMIYDALNYGDQVNGAKKRHQKNKDYKSSEEFLSGFTYDDKLTPVITITLYLGTSKWDGPRSLIEMMPQMDERVFPLINDYKINLLNPLELTDFSMFETGLRPLFEVLKNASDERKLNALITTDDIFKKVDVEYEEKEEVINVCKAWEDHKKLGIQEGMHQGETKMLFTLVTKGKLDIDTAAEEAGVSVSEFEKLMSEAGYKVPETV